VQGVPRYRRASDRCCIRSRPQLESDCTELVRIWDAASNEPANTPLLEEVSFFNSIVFMSSQFHLLAVRPRIGLARPQFSFRTALTRVLMVVG